LELLALASSSAVSFFSFEGDDEASAVSFAGSALASLLGLVGRLESVSSSPSAVKALAASMILRSFSLVAGGLSLVPSAFVVVAIPVIVLLDSFWKYECAVRFDTFQFVHEKKTCEGKRIASEETASFENAAKPYSLVGIPRSNPTG
jgi:hypothetical protein